MNRSTAPGDPIFAQPQPSPDPTGFKDPVTDQKDREINTLEPVPEPRGNAVEPTLTLEQVYGSSGPAKIQENPTDRQDRFPLRRRYRERRRTGHPISRGRQNGQRLR